MKENGPTTEYPDPISPCVKSESHKKNINLSFGVSNTVAENTECENTDIHVGAVDVTSTLNLNPANTFFKMEKNTIESTKNDLLVGKDNIKLENELKTELILIKQEMIDEIEPPLLLNSEFIIKDETLDTDGDEDGLQNEDIVSCDVCDQTFSTLQILNNHKRTHVSERPFSCDLCGTSFSRQTACADHKRSHGEKPFSCDVCEKTFSLKQSLNRHKMNHTVEKLFSCDMCEKRFTVKRSLVKHKRTHLGEKPFVCDVCHKSYTRKDKLITHKRTHTGDKPFSCDVCHKTFTVKQNLIIHKRIHNKKLNTKSIFTSSLDTVQVQYGTYCTEIIIKEEIVEEEGIVEQSTLN